MKNTKKNTPSRQGFTLTEILVSVTILGIMVPAILMSFNYFLRTAHIGNERNVNLSQGRLFTGFFVKHITQAQRSTLDITDDRNTLIFSQYDFTSNLWQSATLQYRPGLKDVIYTLGSTTNQLLTDVEPAATNSGAGMFSHSNSLATCSVRIGKENPSGGMRKHPTPIELNISAVARNP